MGNLCNGGSPKEEKTSYHGTTPTTHPGPTPTDGTRTHRGGLSATDSRNKRHVRFQELRISSPNGDHQKHGFDGVSNHRPSSNGAKLNAPTANVSASVGPTPSAARTPYPSDTHSHSHNHGSDRKGNETHFSPPSLERDRDRSAKTSPVPQHMRRHDDGDGDGNVYRSKVEQQHPPVMVEPDATRGGGGGGAPTPQTFRRIPQTHYDPNSWKVPPPDDGTFCVDGKRLEDYDIEPEGPITPARPPPPMLIESWLNSDGTQRRSPVLVTTRMQSTGITTQPPSPGNRAFPGDTNNSNEMDRPTTLVLGVGVGKPKEPLDDPSPSYSYTDSIRSGGQNSDTGEYPEPSPAVGPPPSTTRRKQRRSTSVFQMLTAAVGRRY